MKARLGISIPAQTMGQSGVHRVSTGTLLARNASLNLLAEVWTFLVLLLAVPKLVSFFGDARYGLFSLAWVIIGYLGFLDIGVNRAATKFVSEDLAQNDLRSIRDIIRTATVVNFVLGCLGGLVVALSAPYLAHSVFKVSGPLEPEARLMFYAVGLAVPVSLLQGAFRAVLSSFQRFGWINGVNAVVITLQWGLAWTLAWRGYSVAVVVLAIVGARMMAAISYGFLLLRLVPSIESFSLGKLSGIKKLLQFGSWVTVSQVVSPVLVYIDRMFVAFFVSLAAVTLYAVPYDVIVRLRVIPASLASTLYPALGERGGRTPEQRAQLQSLYEGSLRYLLILSLPAALLLVWPGPDLLLIWMGRDFASQASTALQILGVGFLFNSLANIPYCTLQAVGRPDLTGKFHLLELPVYVLLCIALIPRWGITGAAIANTLRLAGDALLLFWAARRYAHSTFSGTFANTVLRILAVGLVLAGILYAVHFSVETIWGRLGLSCAAFLVYFALIWVFVLDRIEKPRIFDVLRMFMRQPAS